MRVLGFPLHVRPGFAAFMLLIVVLYGDAFGVWLAVSIAAFTLLHELGHAVAARRAGASAEISLEFLAGYAAYTSPAPLSRRQEVGIALAGPVTHVVAGLAVLVAMGVDPLDPASRGSSPAAAAVWWAGPVIGAFNLIPVLPLDGGNVVTSALDRVLPGRARWVMIRASVAVTAVAAVVFALRPGSRGLVVFVGILLVMQLQVLFAERDRRTASPFDQALDALDRGEDAKARRVLVRGLRRPAPADVMPRAMDADAARRLVALLPRPLPEGDAWNEYVLTNVLLAAGELRQAAEYGAASYSRAPHPVLAATIARAAAGLGDDATATAWLRTAVGDGRDAATLTTIIDRAPELASLRARPDIVALRELLASTA